MINLFSKEYINFAIFFFIIILIILLTSFSLYYILPSNYELYDIKLIHNIKPIKSLNVKIKPEKKYKINNLDFNLNDVIIEIKTNKNYPIKILLNNFLKSQNLHINDNTIFKIKNNSDICIINDNNELIDLDINFYLIEKVLRNK
jgi:hypothetical protein